MNSPRTVSSALLILISLASSAFALGPQDVYILVNKNVADSQAVADHVSPNAECQPITSSPSTCRPART